LIARCHLHRRSDLLKPGFHVGSGEWSAQLGLFVLKLRLQVGAEFGEDVVLPPPRQCFFTACR